MNHIFWLRQPFIAGRPGLVMAAYLVAVENMRAKQAMDEVLSVRPVAFTAQGWREFCFEVLSDFQIQINFAKNSVLV